MSIAAETAPDTFQFKSQDFLCSEAVKTAPLGGYNEFSVDSSVILNSPRGPDGHPLVFIWADPKNIPLYKEQGFQPVPNRWFKKDFNGGLPLESASPTIDKNAVDGLVYKEGRIVVLLCTSKQNASRLERINAEVAIKCSGGIGRNSTFVQEEDKMLRANSHQPWEFQSMRPVAFSGGEDDGPSIITKASKLPMAGPKQ